MNTINYVSRHGKRRPRGAEDVLTHVKVHKCVDSLDFVTGADSNGTESVLSYDGVIAFLGGL